MTNKNFDFCKFIKGYPEIAVRPKKAIGAQQAKSVKTSIDILFAIVMSFIVALVF